MNEIKLNSEIILDKVFDVDIRGYNAKQVDMFLDVVYSDYLSFEKELTDLQQEIQNLKTVNDTLKQQLEAQTKEQVISNELMPTESVNTIDILKRLSMLEQEVYNSK
ncbi:MAG: DivIVA domain-containing protein [Bacilli bacterium]|jgi:DivIVA domain-containing protein|nr:DivIVA domain-containing protein [Bacilli bacterium]